MATITSTTLTSSLTTTGLVHKRLVGASSPSLLGLPTMEKKGRVRCSMKARKSSSDAEQSSNMSKGASLMAAAMTTTMISPAMALVDERLSTEGTGLAFGLSNNLLGWILLGVFGLIWSFYIVYTSSLEEDEESGLSL